MAAALLRCGAVAFGGLGGAMAVLDRELVRKRGWVSSADLRDALTYTKPLPGSTVVQVVAFLGGRLAGSAGAAVAAAAFVAPAAVLMTVAAAGSAVLPDSPVLRGALLGLQVAVLGLLAATLIGLLGSQAKTWPLRGIAALTCAAGLVANAALVVVVAGLLGVSRARAAHRRGHGDG